MPGIHWLYKLGHYFVKNQRGSHTLQYMQIQKFSCIFSLWSQLKFLPLVKITQEAKRRARQERYRGERDTQAPPWGPRSSEADTGDAANNQGGRGCDVECRARGHPLLLQKSQARGLRRSWYLRGMWDC